MLRLDTQFDIYNLPCTRLFKVISPAELIEKGTAVYAGDASLSDFALWLDEPESEYSKQLLALPVDCLLLPTSDTAVAGFDGTQLVNPNTQASFSQGT